MRDDIKELLKRYDEIGALILEQKLDEFGDQLDQKPEGVDDATYEEYIQRLAKIPFLPKTAGGTFAIRSLKCPFNGRPAEEGTLNSSRINSSPLVSLSGDPGGFLMKI